MSVTINGNGTVDGLSNLTSGDLTVDTDTLYVDSTNNRVGVGTSSPTYALSIGNANGMYSDGDGLHIVQNTSQLDTLALKSQGTITYNTNYDDGTSNAHHIFKVSSTTEAMRIDSNGDVGIGTDNPSTYGGRLNITEGAVGGETTLVVANNNPNQFIRLGINADVAQIAYDNADSLAFGVANESTTAGLTTEHMRITNSGNVMIGTTAKFDVSTVALSVQMTASAGTVIETQRTLTTTARHLAFFNPNGQVGSIHTSGSSTAYNTSSDYRLKENVAPMSNSIDRLKQLKPSTWSWIQDGSHGEGFIAHEVQDVVPEAIHGTKDEVDDEGNPVYQGIDQSKLVPLLTAALQEAITKIEALEARVATLEGN